MNLRAGIFSLPNLKPDKLCLNLTYRLPRLTNYIPSLNLQHLRNSVKFYNQARKNAGGYLFFRICIPYLIDTIVYYRSCIIHTRNNILIT